ncbi:LysE family translocator [Kushneria aurantia]|uniref:LysE family translocator n=1 Tax=Kushneria aurantia TaxID=504092 RepID=A0ABV6G319_9GAMM|nr:LysE family translocator [Kushneria aurantia]
MDLISLLVYFFADFTAYLIPGPAALVVSIGALLHGRKAGCALTAGILTAETFYFALSAAGIGVVIAKNQELFAIIKYAGACYLIWLGVRDIRAGVKNQSNSGYSKDSEGEGEAPSIKSSYWKGVSVNISNPKALLVYLAILPQFVDPSRSALIQVSTLYLVGMLAGALAFMIYILLSDRLRKSSSSSFPVKKINIASGVMLIVIGLFFGVLG